MRLIDADKTKEVLTKLLYETALNNSGGASLMCEDIAENRLETWIGLVPTVDAEPVKHGLWIWDDEGYHCSECFFHAYGNTLECMDGTYRFCPNCGAKMEVADHDI